MADAIGTCHDVAAALQTEDIDATVDLALLHATEFHDTIGYLFRSPRDHQVLGDGGSYGLFGRAFLQQDVGVHAAVLGLERLADIISEERPPTASAADFAVLTYPEALGDATALCDRLRTVGVRVWDQTICLPIRHHLREIADLGIPASTIIGDRERSGHPLQVRRLDGSMVSVAPTELVAWLKAEGLQPSRARSRE
jgi:histidyl-tRNA synthetase